MLGKERDPRLRALAHPARLRILALVAATPVSAVDISAATGIAHAAASYHLRQLAAAGLLEIVEPPAKPRSRGRPTRLYQMRDGALDNLNPDASRLLHGALLSELGRRIEAGGSVIRTADAEVWLSADDWARVIEHVRVATEIVHTRALPPNSRTAKHVAFTSFLLEVR